MSHRAGRRARGAAPAGRADRRREPDRQPAQGLRRPPRRAPGRRPATLVCSGMLETEVDEVADGVRADRARGGRAPRSRTTGARCCLRRDARAPDGARARAPSCRSPSSTPASAGSPCSTSASSRCPRRTTSTSATTRAFPTGPEAAEELREHVEQVTPLPARPRREAAGDRLQLGDLGRPGGRARDRRRGRGGGGRGDRARGRDRRGDHRHGQGRRARDAGHGAERRLPAGARAPAPRADGDRGRGARPGRGDPARLPVRRERGRDGALLLRAAEAGRGRHGDPRLHPLPAGARRCCSGSSAATCAWSPPATRSPRPRSGSWRSRGSRRAATERGPTASSAPATPRPSASSAPASCRCRSGEVERVDLP